jgi:hypothetical protein
MQKPVHEDFGLTSQKYIQLVEERTQLRNSMSFLEGDSSGIVILGVVGFFVGTFIAAVIARSMGLPFGNKSIDVFGICGGIGGAIVGRYYGFIKLGRDKIILKQLSAPKYNKIDLYDEAIKKYELCQKEYWKSLRGVEFEKALANLYRSLRYSVQETKRSHDEGIDLFLQKDGKRIIVQCKGHEKPIGRGVINALYGVLMHDGSDSAVLACPAGFTNGVREFADGKPIELIALKEIIEMAESVAINIYLGGRKAPPLIGGRKTPPLKGSIDSIEEIIARYPNLSPEMKALIDEFNKRKLLDQPGEKED